jgi:hypothetical protein
VNCAYQLRVVWTYNPHTFLTGPYVFWAYNRGPFFDWTMRIFLALDSRPFKNTLYIFFTRSGTGPVHTFLGCFYQVTENRLSRLLHDLLIDGYSVLPDALPIEVIHSLLNADVASNVPMI